MPLLLTTGTLRITNPMRIEQIRQIFLDDHIVMNEAMLEDFG
eukprot:CAMPEP_0113720444 /NCGR_PEP_ID=MMETSP0038_2-20120614/36477_1 /TAXON_ID=2898 /ORGANISM="Cryptomonas paramecium" /LENGTH=41 /DNA_ID=CAMNT_0000649135 /DNA_START=51 /DNA_END=172 /DNA_ORIENTATION=+ /assembly_acc=CAM_ASM_000170